MTAVEVGDYLYTRHGYYEVTQISREGKPLAAMHDQAKNTYAVSCCRDRYYVDGILDSYPVIGVVNSFEYMVLKLSGDLIKCRPPRQTSATGKR